MSREGGICGGRHYAGGGREGVAVDVRVPLLDFQKISAVDCRGRRQMWTKLHKINAAVAAEDDI